MMLPSFWHSSEAVKVFPINFTDHILPCPGHQFIKTHLYRELKLVVNPGMTLNALLIFSEEFRE
jgi:hypothetical protein